MIREWGGIDRYRMDKFMLLIRKIMDQTFLYLDNVFFVLSVDCKEKMEGKSFRRVQEDYYRASRSY